MWANLLFAAFVAASPHSAEVPESTPAAAASQDVDDLLAMGGLLAVMLGLMMFDWRRRPFLTQLAAPGERIVRGIPVAEPPPLVDTPPAMPAFGVDDVNDVFLPPGAPPS